MMTGPSLDIEALCHEFSEQMKSLGERLAARTLTGDDFAHTLLNLEGALLAPADIALSYGTSAEGKTDILLRNGESRALCAKFEIDWRARLVARVI